MHRPARSLTALALPAVLLLVSACAASGGSRSPRPGSVSWTSATSTGSWSSGGTVSVASCSGDTCTITLGGAGASVQVNGETIAFERISAGRAALRVGGRPVSCAPGEQLASDLLDLRCTGLTADTVTLRGTRR